MEITRVREICYSKAREFGYNLYCPILINTRFRRTLGRVSWDEYGDLSKIEFSAQFLESESDENIIHTILHELAHAFVFLETGEIHGHDATFKDMCHRLGTVNDGMYAKVGEAESKYTLYCSKCGKVVGKRHRACKITRNPEQFFSGCCHAEVIVEQNWF